MSGEPTTKSSAESPTFTYDTDGIGWITFDDPERKQNVLTERVMRRLGKALDEARAAGREGRIRALVIRSGKEAGFIAGADVGAIAELENPAEAEEKVRLGQAVFTDLATLTVPTIAAIRGVCLGGGLELALACDCRVLARDGATQLGLPEVMLGILPAWGGTTRLPRLIGLQAALDLLLTGRQVDAERAARVGMGDKLVPSELFEREVARFAHSVAHGARPAPGTRRRGLFTRLLDDTRPGRILVLKKARARVLERTGGHYPAPLRILDLLADHLAGPLEASLAAEARAAGELIVTPECKNLIHVFLMREAARKGSGVSDSGATPRPVERVAVIGAGVMGGGIAQLAASRGVHAYMKDIRSEAVASGLRHARTLFEKRSRRGRLSRQEVERGMERISGGLDDHGLRQADLVIEAVVERMDVKREVLADAERQVPAACVLATNTSSLSVAEMAGALERPERFLGMHFFNPVHRMPLVEVVRGPETSDDAVARVYRFAVALGKVPVVTADGPGFLVNRILGPYLNEGGFLLGKGWAIEAIDQVATDFGMPMGPLRLVDEVGIDVARHAGETLHEALGPRMAPAPVLIAIGRGERLGRKGGAGFYRYRDGKEDGPDGTVYTELDLPSPSERGRQAADERDDLRARLVLSMINEAARLLEEGIVPRAADVDLAMIMGTGFPPFRGGLLRFADSLHARRVVDRLESLAAEHGDRFAPAPLLRRLADEDQGFYDLYPSNGSRAGR